MVILLSMFLLCVAGIAAYHFGFMSEQLVLQQLKVENAVDLPKEREPIPAQDTSGLFMWRVHGVGFFDDPNDFAQAIVMALPWLLWFSRPGRWFRNLVVLGMPAGVMIYTIFLTNSRGALLGVASLVFFGIRNMLGTARTFMMMGVLGLASTIGSFTGGRGFTTQEESARQRIEAWYEGILMLRSSPLFGVGYGNFTDRHYLTAHNSFVLCFSELGLLGYFCWIAMLVLAFKAASLVADQAPPGSAERKAGDLLRSSFVGYVTCAWFLSRTYQPTLYVLLALCIAVLYCAKRNPEVLKIPAFNTSMPWAKATFGAVIMSLSAVYAFILLDRIQQ
ncbi:O-antigen ligase family protein [Aquabacterium sp.]|uniref:O-antigen ligase family protein n=1 Tax=Aquabacterium sp. TaxID=1872578 RepID=UPI003D6D8354